MRWLAAVLAILLSGCTTWRHPTKGESEYQADYYACEKDAAPQQDPLLWRSMMERCMRVKGWRAE